MGLGLGLGFGLGFGLGLGLGLGLGVGLGELGSGSTCVSFEPRKGVWPELLSSERMHSFRNRVRVTVTVRGRVRVG